MRIIGCDLHARQQTISMLDTESGEVIEKTLQHEGEEVREFYAALSKPVLVGLGAPRLGSLCSWAMPAKFSNLFLPISTATYSNLRCFSLRIWSC